jgi:ElaB/YqjD/DUF883 family membrane-anchored ribosome-binding protein
MNKYNERLQKMEKLIEKKGEKLDQRLDAAQERIQNRFEHRNQNLERVMQKAPESAKPGLQKALDNSKKQLQNLGTRIQDQIKRRDQKNEQLRLRLQNVNGQRVCGECPQFVSPAPNWCSDGTIVSGKKDECDCQMPPNCVR